MAYIDGKEILFSTRIGGGGNLAKRVDGSITEVTAADLEGIKIVNDYAFAYCSNLASIELPEGITAINGNAFAYTSIKTITIPDSVATVGGFVFSYCSNLETVTFGRGVTSFTSFSLGLDCTSLKTMVMRATTPPTMLNSNPFNNAPLEKIVVPTGCGDAYKSATNWSALADKIVEE